MDQHPLDGRVIVVTGAAGGIGEGIARAVLDDGGIVALWDLDRHRTEQARSALGAGDRTAVFAVDITDVDAVANGVAATLACFEKIDGLVNNAGVISMAPAWNSTAPEWDRHFGVNVVGSFMCAQAVGVSMKERGGGSIVNVSSNCGKVGYPNMAAYNASKAAVLGLTRSLAMEWASDNINVNAVCPGGVDTPMLGMVADWLSPRLGTAADELLAAMGPEQLGRRIQPIEVGRVVSFLLSDDAAIIRGQAINVDGGDTPY